MKATITISDTRHDSKKLLGKAAVDSGNLSVIDRDNFRKFFVIKGKERTGFIVGKNNGDFAEKIKKRFGLQYRAEAGNRIRLVRPVSGAMQKDIEDYLEKNGGNRYQLIINTGNTCDSITDQLEKTYRQTYSVVDHVMDNKTGANIIVFSSGYGDGEYDVFGYYAGGLLVKIEICME